MSEHPGVSLREYIEAIIDERDKRYDQRWQDQQRALESATTVLNERLNLLNELRGNVVSREEYEAKLAAQDERIDTIRGDRRQGVAWVGTLVLGAFIVLGVIAQIVIAIVPHA